MKVAYFIGALNRGGMESLVLDICRHRELMPFEIMCIYRNDGTYTKAYQETGVRMIKLSRKRSLFQYIAAFRRMVLAENIDIIHSQTPSNTMISAVALFGTKVKIITSFHGHEFAKAPLWQRSLVYNASKNIICVSNYEKQYYEKAWHLPSRNKLCVVHNGIDFGKLEGGSRGEPLPGRTDARKMCMVGSFCSGRAQIKVCETLAYLAQQKETPKIDFYFIGGIFPGEEYLLDECQNYCYNHQLMLQDSNTDAQRVQVYFVGVRDDIPAILHSVDEFVYWSEHDTFGVAVVEAMASGVPVVVNDWAVMREVTNNGEWAAIYSSDSIEACGREMMKALDSSSTKLQKIQEEVKNRYSIQNHIKQICKIYNQYA